MSAALHRALFRLLTEPAPAPGSEAALALAPLHEQPAEAVEAIADRERALPNLLDHLAILRPPDGRERERRARMRDKHASGLAVGAALPESVVLLKGANIHRHYPPGAARFSGDIDVMIRDYADLAPLHAALQSLGYTSYGAGLWGFRTARPEHGLASLRYRKADAEDSAVTVEVQVGGFPIDLWRCVRHDELCRGATRLQGNAYLTLSPDAQLLLAFADFVGRNSPISVRHLADVSLVVRHAGSALDQDYLRARIRDLGLEAGVRRMLDAASDKGLSECLPQALRELLQPPRRESAVARECARSDPPLAGPLRRRAAAGLVRAARAVCRLRPDARWPLALSMRPRLVRFVLDSGYRVYGIPLSFRSSSATRTLRTSGGLHMIGGSGIYALSLCGDCSGDNRKWLFDRLRRDSASAPAGKKQDETRQETP